MLRTNFCFSTEWHKDMCFDKGVKTIVKVKVKVNVTLTSTGTMHYAL